mgnify:CR=1 FL=1
MTTAELIAHAEDLMRQRDVLSGLRVFSAVHVERYSEALDDLADLVPDLIAALRTARRDALLDAAERLGRPADRTNDTHLRAVSECRCRLLAMADAPRATTPTP